MSGRFQSAWLGPLWVGLCLGASCLPAAVDDWTPAHVKAAGHADNSLLALGVLDVTLYNGWDGHPVDPTGQRDSTKALQKAIDAHAKVFLPKGTYKISQTLNLRAGTKLFDLSKAHTTIATADEWLPTKETRMLENRNCGVLRIRDSRNILVVGHGGHSIVADDVAAFELAGSRDVVLAVLGSSRYNPKGQMVCQTGIESDARFLPQAGVVAHYKRGEFQEANWLEVTR